VRQIWLVSLLRLYHITRSPTVMSVCGVWYRMYRCFCFSCATSILLLATWRNCLVLSTTSFARVTIACTVSMSGDAQSPIISASGSRLRGSRARTPYRSSNGLFRSWLDVDTIRESNSVDVHIPIVGRFVDELAVTNVWLNRSGHTIQTQSHIWPDYRPCGERKLKKVKSRSLVAEAMITNISNFQASVYISGTAQTTDFIFYRVIVVGKQKQGMYTMSV